MKLHRLIHRTRIILLALALFILAACTANEPESPVVDAWVGPIPTPVGDYWPTGGWQASAPEEQGMDSAVLVKMLDEVKARRIALHSLLVIRHGYIVSETYFPPYEPEDTHHLYSVTKSFIGTLVGIAVDQGELKLEDRVASYFPERSFASSSDTKAAITVEDLLTMRSGLAWEERDPVYRQMYMSRDWVAMVMDLPMSGTPGETFSYCSGCSHVLSALLQETVGDTEAFAQENLFEPLGIKNYTWEKDAQGIALGGWGLNITPRDMAKLGYLYLHNGNWDGQQIVPADWVDAATTRHVEQRGRLDYGYQWWIYDSHGAYVAVGRDGQMVWVSPRLDLIVVTTAQTSNHDEIYRLIDRFVVQAIQD